MKASDLSASGGPVQNSGITILKNEQLSIDLNNIA
jgi:hypothetical protein